MIHFIIVSWLSFIWAGTLAHNNEDAFSERIVGGIDADIEDFPYQISLQYKERHMCGGSILSSKIIVTAAHCTDGADVTLMSVRAGSSIRNEGGEVVKAEEIIQHALYNSSVIDYDVSVIKLQEHLKFRKAIQPIKIIDRDIGFNHFAVVTGWGTLEENGKVSDHLQQVYVPLLKDEECKSFYGNKKITDRMICAGYVDGGHDSCQGDSGGPLVYRDKLIGIVSWGIGCARPNYPGVYTSVSKTRSYLKTFLES